MLWHAVEKHNNWKQIKIAFDNIDALVDYKILYTILNGL